ncbi:MAG: DUF6174 domain-containing protein, partial [Longimicrobiales bacterium]|nr:DUF6174 domain-containing protein [Longimicrobiales bacterium]
MRMKIENRRRLRAGLWGVASLFACLAAAGCDDQGPNVDTLRELDRNRFRWQLLGIDSYRYAVERICYCGLAGPVRVTVLDGTVESRVFVESGDTVPPEGAGSYPSVDGLFEVILDAIQRDAFRIDVTYAPDTGVPLDIFIDYEENV